MIRRNRKFGARISTLVDNLDLVGFIGFFEYLNNSSSRTTCEPYFRHVFRQLDDLRKLVFWHNQLYF